MARKRWWLAALLYGVTLAAYAPGLWGGFLWNDSDYVTAPALRSWGGLARIWFEVGAVQQYYPVVHTAFWVEHCLWGDATLGYHLVNVLLHATAALLFVLVLRRLWSDWDKGGPAAWLAGFLFALHPVCAESVNWISEQKNTFSTVFYLAAAVMYLRFVGDADGSESRPYLPGRDASPRRPGMPYALATFFFILALLSKSFAATLPAALLVARWWKKGRLDWREDVRPLLPWFVIGAAGGLFTAWVEYRFIGAQGAVFSLGPVARLLLAGRVVWFYLGKFVWPHPLIFIYPRWTIDAGAAWQYLYPLLLFALLAALWAGRRRRRGPLAALLFFIGSLFPVLGFFNVYAFNFSYVADHFQYLPCLGLIALAAGGWGRLRTKAAWVPWLPAGVVLLLGAGLTWQASHDYRDLPTFYEAILRKNPGAVMAHNNLGAWLRDQGRLPAAQAEYEAALRLRPDYVEALDNLGLMRVDQNRLPDAIRLFQSAIAHEPAFADPHRNLANALFRSGRVDEAMAQYQEALRLQKKDAHTWNDLGFALFKLNRIEEAAEQFRNALRSDPYFAPAHGNLGNALMRLGEASDGIAEYRRALRLDPSDVSVRSNFGMALAQTGRLDEALVQFQEVLRAQPGLEEARNNYGNVLLAMGRPREAAEQFAGVLQADPRSVQANNNLGNVYFRTGHVAEAVERYQAALAIDPGYLESHVNLGEALCRLGRWSDGIAEFEAALRIDPDSAPAKRALEQAESARRAKEISGPTR